MLCCVSQDATKTWAFEYSGGARSGDKQYVNRRRKAPDGGDIMEDTIWLIYTHDGTAIALVKKTTCFPAVCRFLLQCVPPEFPSGN
jgi:hypothetical protein